jgi:hypothetical protein
MPPVVCLLQNPGRVPNLPRRESLVVIAAPPIRSAVADGSLTLDWLDHE